MLLKIGDMILDLFLSKGSCISLRPKADCQSIIEKGWWNDIGLKIKYYVIINNIGVIFVV